MPNQSAHTFNLRFFLCYVAVGLAAIFYLPSLVPLRPTASDSYLFGYNNRAAVVLLLMLVTIAAIWTKGLNLKLPASGASLPVPRKTLLISLVAVLAGCLAMYLLAGRFGGFGESSYEIDRAWLLSQSRIPYVDFEWPFGVALLYGPLLFSRLLSIGIVPAYYLFWALNCLLGTVLLFAVVNRIDYPTKSKKFIYLILFCSWFLSILNMGTHYTLVRYTCPLYFILVVHRIIKGAGAGSKAYGTLLAVAFTAVLLLISPETAIAYAFASICVFALAYSNWKGVNLGIFAGLIAALGAVFLAAMKLHVLDTVRASGGGADSFPISFAPFMLLFFAAVFLCACYVYLRLTQRHIDDNTVGLVAFSIPMLAAALSRCDPGHVLMNGLGIFLASMFYASNHRTAWKWYRAVFVVVLILLSAISGTWFYLPSLARCGFNILSESNNGSQISRSLTYLGRIYIAEFANPTKRAKWEKTLENAHLVGVPKTVDLSSIYPSWHGTFLAPFGYKPNGFGTYLSNQVDYGHYEGFENANTVEAIHVKLTEIKRHPEKALLLPDHFESYCQINIPAERREISVLFAFPYLGRAVHTESVRQPICDYISAQYELGQGPTPENFEYGLWVAKSAKN
jgi:hypothetical protein